MLSVGLIGLPNVGKSTLFNALTAGEARVSNYPFTTIDSNVGVVAVPDTRLAALAKLLEPAEVTPCHVEFIDIAGLVEGASRGEGLGNQFLGNIRTVDALVHVLRCFEQPDVAHVYAELDPLHDAGVIETELLLADLEVLGRHAEKRKKIWATEPRESAAERALVEKALAALERGEALSTLELDAGERARLHGLGMLTGKPLVYAANVAEGGSVELPAGLADRALAVDAKLEGELRQLDADERREFMAELGLEESGLDRLIELCFDRLGLIRFYTLVSAKLRAWEVPRGTPAPRAAGQIHSDMEERFIRAEVMSSEDLLEAGDPAVLHSSGRVRTEGRAYEIRDGDVVEFRFGRA